MSNSCRQAFADHASGTISRARFSSTLRRLSRRCSRTWSTPTRNPQTAAARAGQIARLLPRHLRGRQIGYGGGLCNRGLHVAGDCGCLWRTLRHGESGGKWEVNAILQDLTQYCSYCSDKDQTVRAELVEAHAGPSTGSGRTVLTEQYWDLIRFSPGTRQRQEYPTFTFAPLST